MFAVHVLGAGPNYGPYSLYALEEQARSKAASYSQSFKERYVVRTVPGDDPNVPTPPWGHPILDIYQDGVSSR